MRWKRSLMNVEYIAISALEKITADRHHTGADELHVIQPVHLAHHGRAQAQPEGEQVDDGLEDAENVLDFQKERKFATSRLITPAIAAGSRRLIPPPPR